MTLALRATVGLLLLAIPCCAGGHFETGAEGGVYRDGQTAYRVGPLDRSWHRFGLSGGDLAFRDDSGGSILANAFCEGIKDVPLDVLTNQALMGLEQKQEHGREIVTLDGRAALRTRLSAAVDGVPVELELVVTKKDGCTYDFELAAGERTFADREAAFWRFVQGFRQLPRNSPGVD
jgi:hypothetical protein